MSIRSRSSATGSGFPRRFDDSARRPNLPRVVVRPRHPESVACATHASEPQIAKMLDGFVSVGAPGSAFLTSVVPVTADRPDYVGDEWVGRSHESDVPGIVAHSLDWIHDACADRGLIVGPARPNVLNQHWLIIRSAP